MDLILEAWLAYYAHQEGCWYVGNPANLYGRGCSTHNELYDHWQKVRREDGSEDHHHIRQLL